MRDSSAVARNLRQGVSKVVLSLPFPTLRALEIEFGAF